jgi:hypothetical protein
VVSERALARRYALTTHWVLDAPIDQGWDALVAVEDWPRWWRYVHAVVELEAGDAQGLGALRRYTWSSRLPYRLAFAMRTTAMTRPTLLEGRAEGDLNGTGRWSLRALERGTLARYEWSVVTAKAWMNALAPLLAPVFAWNHDQVMRAGGEGLARHLGVALLGFAGSRAGAPE